MMARPWAVFYALINKFARYTMVGTINTIICVSLMYMGFVFGLNYLAFTFLGYGITITLSFYMNLRYTFQVEGDVCKRFVLFWLVCLTNLGIVLSIEYYLVTTFAMKHFLAVFCGMCWYVVSGFLVNNFFIYRQ